MLTELIDLPGGSFRMGSTSFYPDEGPIHSVTVGPSLSTAEITETIDDINAVFPAAALRRDHVIMAHVGLLPGHPDPAMTDEVDKHSEILTGSEHGGPEGLFSIKGVKYTTGLDVGMQAVARVCAYLDRAWQEPPEQACPQEYLQPADPFRAVKREGAVRLADHIFRRNGSGSFRHPGKAALERIATEMGQALGWDEARRAEELADTGRAYARLGIT